MIPKKLRIKNFLSYGNETQELDFDSLQLAVLTGENGAGKSSLIEAIPFCIWGKGRGNNSEVLRKGASEARIELEFESQKNIFRITRILKLKKSTVSQELEFAIHDHSINDFRSLTQAGIRETEAEIQKRIGITYETFISSTFFAQGKADEFIKNGPTDRRRILGEILGLSRYEALSEKAKEKAKTIKGEIDSTLTRIELLKSDTHSLPQLRADYQAKVLDEQHATEDLRAVDSSLLAIDSDLQRFQKTEQELAVLNAKLDALTKNIEREANLIRQKEAEVSAIDARLQSRDALLLKQRESESLKKEIDSLDEKQSRAQSLKEQISKLENDYNAERAKLEAEKKSAQSQLSTLHQLIAQRKKRIELKETMLNKHLQLQTRIDMLKRECARLPEVESMLVTARAKVSETQSSIDSAQKQMNAITEKGKKVKELSGICPLCQSPIDQSHIDHIVETYRQEYRAYQTQMKDDENALRSHKQAVSQLENEVKALKEKEREHNQCVIDLNSTRTELRSVEEVDRELKQFESEKIVQEAKAQEAEKELRSLAQSKLAIESLQSELSAVGYDPKLHQRKKSELQLFESLPRELAALESDAKRKDALIQEIAHHRAQSESLRRQCDEKEASCASLRQALTGKANVEARKQSLLHEKREKEKRQLDISSQRQSLERNIAEKDEKERISQDLERNIAPKREEQELYEILAEAYSVKGVQQLLLEQAIPEIERIANELLSRLTRNLFSLTIQTEQQTQNNTTRPSLDIIISDANGNNRPYETFSGGERFRIDFSLRLALSKYLSNISGTPIKMLVIDEGFGTQDEFGIQAMIEAMNTFSYDFEKIILITHLDEMKEAFSTRIVVNRDPLKGSRFEVIF